MRKKVVRNKPDRAELEAKLDAGETISSLARLYDKDRATILYALGRINKPQTRGEAAQAVRVRAAKPKPAPAPAPVAAAKRQSQASLAAKRRAYEEDWQRRYRSAGGR